VSGLPASPPEELPFASGAGIDANAPAAVATHAPRLPGAIWSPRFLRILIAQTTFSFGWSSYLLAPKYFSVELGADARTVGQLSAMGGLFTVATIPLLARGIDRLGGKTFFAGACALLLLVSTGFIYVRELGPALYVLNGLVATACVLAFNAGATLATGRCRPHGWVRYRRLFPAEFVTSCKRPPGERPLHGGSTWGQFVDFRDHVKPGVRDLFLARLHASDFDAEHAWEAFPYPVLKTSAPFEVFCREYR